MPVINKDKTQSLPTVPPFMGQAYCVIPVLEFLKGKSCTRSVWTLVSALRPSAIRVCHSGSTMDAVPWRVTVWLCADGKTIRSIEQEVTVLCDLGVSGADVMKEFNLERQ